MSPVRGSAVLWGVLMKVPGLSEKRLRLHAGLKSSGER